MKLNRAGGSADFTVEETATGSMVDFRLTNEETIGAEDECARVFTWRSKGLVDNFEIRVSVLEAHLGVEFFDMRAEILAAAVERAKLELQDPDPESSQENPLFA